MLFPTLLNLFFVASTLTSAATPLPPFVGEVQPLPPDVVKEMKETSWHQGCPVDLSALRLVKASHVWEGKVHQGQVVVNVALATELLSILKELYQQRFPIETLRRIDAYAGDDGKSMAANNTSAFNCRAITGGKKFSLHSYGVAIDINPLRNPYVRTRRGKRFVEPPEGKKYLDRNPKTPGLITKGDNCYRAFTSRGWTWGGNWRSLKDYQHFEKRL